MSAIRRSVAMFCYCFPPLGGGGTPRSVKFVKYLSAVGWAPTVLTGVRDEQVTGLEFSTDLSQQKDLAATPHEVIRVRHPPSKLAAAVSRGKLGVLARSCLYPIYWEDARPWAQAAAQAAIDRHRRAAFDVLYVSAAPFSAIEAAAKVSAITGVPFVADLRDLWTQDTMWFTPSRLHYQWQRRLEKRTLSRASAIILNTPGALRSMTSWLGDDFRDRLHCIPNGFDPAETPPPQAREPRDGDRTLTILHAGTMYAPGVRKSRLGRYRPYDIDDTARSVVPLLAGVAHLRLQAPDLASRVRIRLVGYVPPGLDSHIKAHGLIEQVSVEGVVSRDRAMRAMEEADALLVVQFAFADSLHAVPYVPGKTYEYLPLQKPIVAPVGAGDVRDLLASMSHAYVSDYRNPADIALQLRKMIHDIDTNCVEFRPEQLTPFRRDLQARRLSEILETAARSRTSVRGVNQGET